MGLFLYMKLQNNPTIINCAEDLYKILFIAVEEKIYISNLIPPIIIENLLEISSKNLKFIYFDFNELKPDNNVKLIKNGTVEFKLNKKIIIYKQKYKYFSKNKEKFKTTMIPNYIKKYCNYTIKTQKIRIILQ